VIASPVTELLGYGLVTGGLIQSAATPPVISPIQLNPYATVTTAAPAKPALNPYGTITTAAPGKITLNPYQTVTTTPA